jgi:GMP synthase (glutamine-hydrolysing)
MQLILVCRHSPSEHLGLLEATLSQSVYHYYYTDLYENINPLDDIPDYKALIILGGAASANDPLPHLHREYAILAEALELRKPVLGICLGAQMLAKAIGGAVGPAGQAEIGWHPVEATREAGTDRLFFDFGRRIVFHWHKECIDLPPDAVRLASSEACLNQAFRYRDFAWGIQFHPEVTPAMIARWCVEDDESPIPERTGEIDPFRHTHESAAIANLLFQRWLEQISRRDS